MPADLVHDDNPALARLARKTTPAAALATLGIVYGDLGTSPLCTLQAVVGATGGHFSSEAALGTLSLVFWALTITISVKYCLFVMRADNHGEGGILALMSMTGANWSEGGRILIVMGLFGAALLYGDGIITPAISVLSALEGLNVVSEQVKPMALSDGEPASDGDVWFRIATHKDYIKNGRVQHGAFGGNSIAAPSSEKRRAWDRELSGQLRSHAGSVSNIVSHAEQFCSEQTARGGGTKVFHGVMYSRVADIKKTYKSSIVSGVHFTPKPPSDAAHSDLTLPVGQLKRSLS